MDSTGLFLATVKMVKTRNKNLDAAPAMAATRLREMCHFTQQAKAIVKDLTQLRDFIKSHIRDYVNVDQVLDGAISMSDYERDQIDTQSQTVLKTCTYVLKNLRNSVRLEKCSPERYYHRQEMVELVSAFLTAVAKLYGEQKAIRVSRAVEMKKLFRLENMVKFTETSRQRSQPEVTDALKKSASPAPEAPNGKESTEAAKVAETDAKPESPILRQRLAVQKQKGGSAVDENGKGEEKRVTNPKLVALEADTRQQEEEWSSFRSALSDGEKKQLEVEKEHLFDELRSTADEIQILEAKVTEITRLQDIFTTKVLEQEQDIYRINEVAIHTTENIKAGNESIREAMKKKAGFRVYILFFLLVMSFTLLFLDWYNP